MKKNPKNLKKPSQISDVKKESIKKEKHPGGRPSSYTPEWGDLICQRVATHTIGLPTLCKMYDDMPAEDAIQRWRYSFEEFRVKYAQAKMFQADLLAEECLYISNDSSEDYKIDEEGNKFFNSEAVARARLKIDTRKWLASKLLPKQYGDKLLLEQKTEENEKLKEELKILRNRLDQKNYRDF